MANLTGVIPPWLQAPLGQPAGGRPVILFPPNQQFSWFQGPWPAGTFVPTPDYFSSRGAKFCVVPVLKRKLQTEVLVMLSWVVTFLIVALIAGILGFGGIAGVSIEIAKTIFFIAVVLFLISAVVGLARGRSRV
jgi:uncharacterized membrane protein YtjA (UPF0391 family)